jgi:hypothetical protein
MLYFDISLNGEAVRMGFKVLPSTQRNRIGHGNIDNKESHTNM